MTFRKEGVDMTAGLTLDSSFQAIQQRIAESQIRAYEAWVEAKQSEDPKIQRDAMAEYERCKGHIEQLEALFRQKKEFEKQQRAEEQTETNVMELE